MSARRDFAAAFVRARRSLVPSAVVVCAGLWLTRAFWAPGGYVVGFDTFAYSGPNSYVTTAAVRAGRLPLINDTIFAGVPHLGNPQTGVMYVPRLLALVMDTNRAMGLLVSLHVILLGIGMRRLLGRLSISPSSSTFGAVVLMASGAVMTKSVQFEQILVLTWLPWLLASIHRLTVGDHGYGPRERMRSIGLLALVTAAVCSAGHPQLTYQVGVTAALFWIASTWHARAVGVAPRRIGSSVAAISCGVVLGVALVLPQMWAALQATRNSALSDGRDLGTLGTADLALTVHRSARAILGTVRSIDPGLFVGSFEPIAYLGVSLVLLAVVGAVSSVRHTATRIPGVAFAAIGIGSFVVALGPRTVLFRAAFRLLPGFDFARVSARWLVILAFAVCVLAAFGLDAVKARVDRSVLVVTPIVISLGAVYVIGATTLPDGLTSTIWILTGIVVMVLLVISSRSSRPERFMWACCVLALTEVLLGSVSSLPQHLRSDTPFTSLGSSMSDWLSRQEGYTIALTPDFGPLSDVVVGLRPNANTLLGIRSVDGYDGGVQITRRWADALQRFNPNPMVDFPLRNNLVAPIDTHVAARTGIRHLVVDRTLHGDEVARGWVGPVRSQGVLDVYSNPDWRGDALSWPVARAFDRGEINDVLRARSNSFVDVALVEADATIVADSCRTRCAVSRWDVVRVHPERIELSGVSDVPSLVSYPRQAGSGWRATIDGLGAPIVPLDALYLAVEVPAGSHTVVFEFRPKWLFPSLVVSALASIAVIAFVVRPGRASSRSSRRRTRDSEQAGPLS